MARATKDIDFDWDVETEELTELLLDASSRDLGDFFDFEVERAEAPPEAEAEFSQRWRITASCDGRVFERAPCDVAIGKEPVVAPESLELPRTLEFAGLDRISVPSLAVEQHLAEKMHAYSRRYGSQRKPSSRVKDLVDLALLAVMLEPTTSLGVWSPVSLTWNGPSAD